MKTKEGKTVKTKGRTLQRLVTRRPKPRENGLLVTNGAKRRMGSNRLFGANRSITVKPPRIQCYSSVTAAHIVLQS